MTTPAADLRGTAATLVMRGRCHMIRFSLLPLQQGGGYSVTRGRGRRVTLNLPTLMRPSLSSRFDSIRRTSIIRG